MFTRHPVSGADEIVIEASWGLGEAIVEGLVIPDHFRLAKDGTLREKTAGTKDVFMKALPGGGVEETPIDDEERVSAFASTMRSSPRSRALACSARSISARDATSNGRSRKACPLSPAVPLDHGGRPGLTLRLIGLGLSAMLVPLGSTMIAVALPAIGRNSIAPRASSRCGSVNSYLLVNIVALGPGGEIADRWGYRNALGLGQVLFGAGCLLPILWPSFATLVASRVLMALGGALMVPTVMAAFRIAVPAEQLPRVFGYFGALMTFAAAVGPSLGGLLVHHFRSGGSIFLVNPAAAAGLGFLLGDLLPRLVRRKAESGQRRGLRRIRSANLALFRSGRSRRAARSWRCLNLGMYTLLFELPFLLQALYQSGPERFGAVHDRHSWRA
jgi:hypothetical protein